MANVWDEAEKEMSVWDEADAELTNTGRFSVNNMLSNIPESAANYGKAVVSPITSPVETGKALTELATGAFTKGASHILPVPKERLQEEDVLLYENVKQAIKDRYGSWDSFKTTLEQDPVGTIADISVVLGGAGAGAKAVGLSRTGKALSIASKVADPMSLVKAPIKAAATALKKGGQNLYESALKVPPSIDREKRLAAIEYGLEKRIPLTERGANKLYDNIEDIGRKMSNDIKDASLRGKVVSVEKIFSPLDDLKSFYENAIGTIDDVKWLDDFVSTEKEKLLSKYGQNIPVHAAQELKQNTYRILKKKYGEMKSVNIEAQKQVARGLKEEIEIALIDEVPELKKINKELGTSMDLSTFIDRALNRTSNYDVLRLTSKAGGGVGGLIGGRTGALIGYMVSTIVDDPKWKSWIGIQMNKLGKPSGIKFNQGLRNVAYEAGKLPSQIPMEEALNQGGVR